MSIKLNVIFITLDGARADKLETSEKIQQIFSQGTRFTKTITYAPYTIAAMHAVISGEYGFNNGVNDRQNKIVPHSMRHSFASWLALQGESLLTIKELLGHRDITTTQSYAHLLPDTKREAVLKLEENGRMKSEKRS